MKHWIVVLLPLVIAGCELGQPEVHCEGASIVATRDDYLLQQECRLLCADCNGEPADASVCLGGDAGTPYCPCNDNGPVTFCWSGGEFGIACDASTCD